MPVGAATVFPLAVARWNTNALGLGLEEVAAEAEVALEGRDVITHEETVRLWQAAERLSGDPAVGHRAGVNIRVNELGLIGSVFAHAEDVGAGLRHLGVVLPSVLPGHFEVERVADGLELRYRAAPTAQVSRHGVESLLASVVATARHCTRRLIPVVRVALATPRPADVTVYEEFYRAPIEWEAPESVLGFEAAALRERTTAPNQELVRLLLQHAERLLSTAPEASPIERRVTRALQGAMRAGDTSLAGVARVLGMSRRNLQRELELAGATFRDVRAAVMREHACNLLRDADVSVEQVADALGYRSRTAFDRAFVAWTGQSPSRYRRVES